MVNESSFGALIERSLPLMHIRGIPFRLSIFNNVIIILPWIEFV